MTEKKKARRRTLEHKAKRKARRETPERKTKRKARWQLPERKARQKEIRKKYRDIVLKHYGNKCECCGETHKEFLTIDHINGGGKKHKKEIGSKSAFCKWIIDNDFPDDLRILCWNCNCAKGVYGYCPHEKSPL